MDNNHWIKSNNIRRVVTFMCLFICVYVAGDRMKMLLESELRPATFTQCSGKWVSVTDNHASSKLRQQVQYYPVAETNSEQLAIGQVPMLSQAFCEKLIGRDTQILIPSQLDAPKHIFSFIQFWMVSLLIVVLPLSFLVGLFSKGGSQVICFVLFFIILGGSFKELNQSSTLAENSSDKPRQQRNLALDVCIRSAINKQKVTEPQQVTKLICQMNKLTHLGGLEQLENVEEIYLQNSGLTTLTDLPLLPHVKVISIAGIKSLTSLKGIESLTGLEELQANKTGLKDLSGIEALTNLRIFSSMMSKINDINPLENLNNLEDINLSYNEIHKISALANKNNLVKLSIVDNRVSDISALYNNSRLLQVSVKGKGRVSCDQIHKLRGLLSSEAKVRGQTMCDE